MECSARPPLAMAATGLALAAALAGCGAPALSPDTESWSRATAMPTARSALAAAALDGRIYAAGGLTWLGAVPAFEVYDPVADEWQDLGPLPEERHHHAMAAAAGRLYLSGGYAGMLRDAERGQLFAYDPGAGTWQRAAAMPGARARHVMANVGGRLYVMGGVGQDPQSLWVYDPATDTWDASGRPMPAASANPAVAVLDGALYVIGGAWRERPLKSVFVYDPAADTWTRLPDLALARGALTAAGLDGRVHAAGGRVPGFVDETHAAHEAYDNQARAWLSAAPMPTPRHGHASAVIAERWYVIGGRTRGGPLSRISFSDRVEVFTPPPPPERQQVQIRLR